MARVTRPALAQLQLYLSPPPRNINESRAVLRALEQFGQIIMFKALRFEETTKELTPRAHIIFKSETAAKNLLEASQVAVPQTNITIIPSESIFNHPQYIEYASASHYIKDQTLISRRRKGPIDNIDIEAEDTSVRVGSEGSLAPSAQLRDMRSRLLYRYTGDFWGICDLEQRIASQKVQLREQNEKLAKGYKVDLSGRSHKALQVDQLNTIRDILGDLGGDLDEKRGKKSPTR